MMEMNILASSFSGYAKPFVRVNPSLLTLRASSLRHDYPLASKIVVKSNILFSPSYPSILFNVNTYLMHALLLVNCSCVV